MNLALATAQLVLLVGSALWVRFWELVGSGGKESACNSGDLGLILGLGRSPGEGNGYPLQYSGLENSMDSIVHGVTKNRTRLSDFQFYFLLHSAVESKCETSHFLLLEVV